MKAEDFRVTLTRYLSDKMTDKEWQGHSANPMFRSWLRFQMIQCMTLPTAKAESKDA